MCVHALAYVAPPVQVPGRYVWEQKAASDAVLRGTVYHFCDKVSHWLEIYKF